MPKALSYDFSKNAKTGKSEHPETLWDLEMEKENDEAIKGKLFDTCNLLQGTFEI